MGRLQAGEEFLGLALYISARNAYGRRTVTPGKKKGGCWRSDD